MNKSLVLKIIIAIIGIVTIILLGTHKQEPKQTKKIPSTFDYSSITFKKYKSQSLQTENAIPSIISDKTIYLTFDDGPSYLTYQILDVLEEENVPATFFVIGTHIYEYPDIIKRAYKKGHTIALHSDTHRYDQIYSDDEIYFDDLRTINNKVFDLIGHHSRIIRLPGGSSNTVSKKYNSGIITRITNKLTENDYYYFDWNVDSGDASGSLSKEQIYENVTTHLHSGANIILMHDSSVKKTTAEAIRDIIIYGKNNGYTFARINKDTPQIHHGINN